MNFRSFSINLKTLLAVLGVALAYAFATPASAQTTCSGCTTPTTTGGYSFSIGTGVAFGGEGFGSFAGTNGGVNIIKEGFGITESSFNAAGSPCGSGCGDASYTATGSAGERVGVTAWAEGNNAHVINGGNAATLLQFTLQKSVLPAPTGQ